ncbi:hypothetical protein GEV33_001742 [Tenebrio molitor]|uniref:Uncharacterized protein n=1 Tax=Tenebrio molitor TaxID=7067 RepID=A0A8J6LFN5_TENMO|nr:hypothetical protein GEV33_001742 [Tenebrio molitor]
MSNPEMAINLEKEHLRSAEECDYMVMENLIQRRYDDEETDHGPINPDLLSVVTETREYRITPVGARPLRRASAIEGDKEDICNLNTHISFELNQKFVRKFAHLDH